MHISQLIHAVESQSALFFILLESFNYSVEYLRDDSHVAEHEVGVINAGEEGSGGLEGGNSHLDLSICETLAEDAHEGIFVGCQLLGGQVAVGEHFEHVHCENSGVLQVGWCPIYQQF